MIFKEYFPNINLEDYEYEEIQCSKCDSFNVNSHHSNGELLCKNCNNRDQEEFKYIKSGYINSEDVKNLLVDECLDRKEVLLHINAIMEDIPHLEEARKLLLKKLGVV